MMGDKNTPRRRVNDACRLLVLLSNVEMVLLYTGLLLGDGSNRDCMASTQLAISSADSHASVSGRLPCLMIGSSLKQYGRLLLLVRVTT